MGLLEGRSVVVTGSGRGLGRAFALAAAGEGAAVVVNDIDLETAEVVVGEIAGAGGRAVACGSSVATWEGAGELVETCVREFGAIDGLINNAVAYSYFGTPWDETPDAIRTQVEVNLLGSIFCAVHAMRRMRENNSGSIVNICSRSMLGVEGVDTYSITKGALASATFSWSLALIDEGIRVNALAPVALTRAYDMKGSTGGHAVPDAVDPQRIAPAAVYLLSDLSSGLTGQIISLIGTRLGMIAHPRMV
jgi:NAD(P)-dependent dehydrogenase (short-subunit alcohol dehydrogenase family)